MEKEYTIQISPEILELLGPSLYTNVYYILSELIANSYDADAENVWIEVTENSIAVEDDGKGMAYNSGEIDRYLSVAKPTRLNDEDAYTEKYRRPKMGRKGIGKLSALAVSSKVKVMTKSGNDISGFWLDREVPEGNKLVPIEESDIRFKHCIDSGTRVEMIESEFQLPKTTLTIKNNLTKFFPQLSADKTNPFKLHIKGRDNKTLTSENFVDSLAASLDSLIVYGDDKYGIIKKFKKDSPKYAKQNFSEKDEYVEEYVIKNRKGILESRKLKVRGWIGTYNTTRGLKAKESSDFPDNFLAVYSHEKLGKFNILNEIGQNRLNELYVVGQLYVDEFEETSLPDMALSNRQGYKSDDERYKNFLKIASKMLDAILRKKDKAIKAKRKKSESSKLKKKRKDEREFKEKVDNVLGLFNEAVPKNSLDTDVANRMLGELGVKKRRIDSDEKKILISHTRSDQRLNNIIYGLLLFNNFSANEIIYTSDPENKAAVPYGQNVFEYLREFFVKSYSNKDLYVIYIMSNTSSRKEGVQQEVGAGWVVQSNHGIIKAGVVEPKPPLDTTKIFPAICIEDDQARVVCTQHEFGVLVQMLQNICEIFEKKPKMK